MMITSEQIKDLRQRIAALEKSLDIAGKREDVAAKEAQSQAPGFWDDPKAAEAFMKGVSSVKSWLTSFDAIVSAADDLDVLMELADRILVLCGGKVSGIVPGRGADKQQIGMMMTRVGGEQDGE